MSCNPGVAWHGAFSMNESSCIRFDYLCSADRWGLSHWFLLSPWFRMPRFTYRTYRTYRNGIEFAKNVIYRVPGRFPWIEAAREYLGMYSTILLLTLKYTFVYIWGDTVRTCFYILWSILRLLTSSLNYSRSESSWSIHFPSGCCLWAPRNVLLRIIMLLATFRCIVTLRIFKNTKSLRLKLGLLAWRYVPAIINMLGSKN